MKHRVVIMNEREEKLEKASEQKSRIRERYKGVDKEALDIIPAIPPEDFYSEASVKRVAVYARVSTDDPRQTSSYELQKNHYTDMVSRRPDWELVRIYADEGISGTSLQHRDAFIEMIEDCRQKKIDLIVTKSVSRFARNVLDCIGYVRQLKAMQPPIGVFFETENIYTLNPNSEMSLSFISTLAQEESHTKSEIMNSSIEMRFSRGIFLVPELLGYDLDADGNLVINEGEARIIRLIFFNYLYGYSIEQIAETLTKLGCLTKKGNVTWAAESVNYILRNERYCGCVKARKTFTPNYLDHKPKKNRQDRNQYIMWNHHDPIISKDDFLAVQRLMDNAKYGRNSILPELRVIPGGYLKGFVSINPRWAGFKPNDYYLACQSAYPNMGLQEKGDKVEADAGDFDLRGFEIARAQFFNISGQLAVTFSMDKIVFGVNSVREFKQTQYMEMLINPAKLLLAIRPAKKDTQNAMRWSKTLDGKILPRMVSGKAFMPTIYDLLGWQKEYKYRLLGEVKKYGGDSILLFDLREPEVMIPASAIEGETASTDGRSGHIKGYPPDWQFGFGNDYYSHTRERRMDVLNGEEIDLWAEGKPFREPDLKTTSQEVLRREIDSLMTDLKESTANGTDVR